MSAGSRAISTLHSRTSMPGAAMWRMSSSAFRVPAGSASTKPSTHPMNERTASARAGMSVVLPPAQMPSPDARWPRIKAATASLDRFMHVKRTAATVCTHRNGAKGRVAETAAEILELISAAGRTESLTNPPNRVTASCLLLPDESTRGSHLGRRLIASSFHAASEFRGKPSSQAATPNCSGQDYLE